MMRNDGEVTVYVLQFRNQGTKSDQRWRGANLDHFGHPPGFKASSDCWQRTGLDGTFDEEQGFEGLKLMSREHVEYDWRLMRLEISQHHYEVASMSAIKPGTNVTAQSPDYEEVCRRAIAVEKGK
jgi:hypothetical protein